MTIKVDCPINETKALSQQLDKPSLHALSYCLRHPDTWPNEFVWDYKNCGQCAMGLAHALWKSIPHTNVGNGASVMARCFAMPYGAALNIFFGREGANTADWVPYRTEEAREGFLWWKQTVTRQHPKLGAVTPEMVADQIDLYLATAE